MDRSSNKHGPRLDEEMKHEVEGLVRSGHPTRAEEWHDPEPVEDENSPDPQELIEQRAAAERGRKHGDPASDGLGPGSGTEGTTAES